MRLLINFCKLYALKRRFGYSRRAAFHAVLFIVRNRSF